MRNDVPAPNGANGERSLGYRLGCIVSAWVSDLSAHPYAQLGFILICIVWFLSGLSTNLLTAGLSIMAITLSQMVLNRQNEREAEARRRDIAMHAKLDELIFAGRRAHNEMAGIEDLPEDVIVELKEEALQNLSEMRHELGDAERPAPTDAGKTRRPAN